MSSNNTFVAVDKLAFTHFSMNMCNDDNPGWQYHRNVKGTFYFVVSLVASSCV